MEGGRGGGEGAHTDARAHVCPPTNTQADLSSLNAPVSAVLGPRVGDGSALGGGGSHVDER